MKKLFLTSLMAISLILSALSGFSQASRPVLLKSATLGEAELVAPSLANPADFQSSRYAGNFYLIVQFNEIPDQAKKQQLAQNGITLLDYLPHDAFFARVPETFNFSRFAQLNVSRIAAIQPQYKLSRELANGDFPSHALNGNNLIDLVVLPYPGISQSAFRSFLASSDVTLLAPEASGALAVRVNINAIDRLASLAPVMYLEAIEPDPVPDGLRGRTSHRANLLSRQPGTGYDGTGVAIAIADDGGINHIDFQGRLTDFNNGQGGTHGDMTAGIAVGAGNLDPTMVGMGTGAYLNMYSINGYVHIGNAIQNFQNLGTIITSTSYSEVCGGLYTNTAQSLDADVNTQKELLHVFSAGNSSSSSCSGLYGNIIDPSSGGRYGNITGGRKASKNAIATANMRYNDSRDQTSSRGPCEDGRLKPDISAHGNGQLSTAPDNGYQVGGGTSAASPGIGGVATMLTQAYREFNGGANPISSLTKGIMLNTADDLGRIGPDFEHGWGRVNAGKALEVIQNNQFLTATLDQGDSSTHTITVPAGVMQVKVMVIWLDPAGSPNASQALVNNLDMRLTDPSNTTYLPWVLNHFPHVDSVTQLARRGIDNLNNVEQVTLDLPSAGNYTVTVKGTAVASGPQDYHVIYSFVMDEIKVTYPHQGASLVPGETEVIRWDAYGTVGNFVLSYSTNGGSTWSPIGPFSGFARQLDWVVPAAASGDVIVRIARLGLTGDSGPFTILEIPQNIKAGPHDLSTARISWDSVPGATAYDIFMLGEKYMDSIGSSNSTSFLLPNLDAKKSYWLSVRARDGGSMVGRRANAFQYVHLNISSCGSCTFSICGFPYRESFEDGFGDWCSPTEGDFSWAINSGATPSTGTGPSAALIGANYIYVEATDNSPNRVAILNGPCLDLSKMTSADFLFGYHMNGSQMGSLELQVSTDGGDTWSASVWSRSGNQGLNWNAGVLPLTPYVGGPLTLRFIATTGSGFRSDMALDNLAINGVASDSGLTAIFNAADVSCFGANDGLAVAAVSGGSAPLQYLWNTGDTTYLVNNLSAGTYSVAVADSNNCIVTGNLTVSEPAAVTLFVNAPASMDCANDSSAIGSAIPSGGVGNFTYAWSTGASSAVAPNLYPGTHTVTVSDGNGCATTDTFTITSPPAMLFDFTVTHPSGGGAMDGAIDLSLSGATPPYRSVIWSTGATTEDISGLEAGVYTVSVLDAKGCLFTDSARVGFGVGIGDELPVDGLGIYPVPSRDRLFVTYTLSKEQATRLRISDLTGRTLLLQEGPSFPGAHQVDLKLHDLAAGTYLLTVENPKGRQTMKFVKLAD